VRECCAEAGFGRKEAVTWNLQWKSDHEYYPLRLFQEKGEISVVCDLSADQIEFVVKDRGALFNPLVQKPSVDRSAELEEREVGGLGIFFVHQLMDSVHYEREEPFNVPFSPKIH
jgi:anti-sigma regulatory factor (Ser/Thr protein kinase)